MQGVHKTYYLNPFIDSPANVTYAKRLVSSLSKPILSGLSTSMKALATNVRDGVFPVFQPSAIMTGGEVLLPEVRTLIESTFGTRVTDVYACNETRDIAWQCRHAGGYHINADNVLVEIVTGDRRAERGEIGEVVLTDLNRHVMPIIRYKNGDLARWATEPCPCGCRLPMLAEIIGRSGKM